MPEAALAPVATAWGPVVLKIPWDPARCAPNGRKKQSLREQMFHAREGRELGQLFWLQTDRTPAPGPVLVRFVVYRARELDRDNCLAGMKPLIDGLFNGKRRDLRGGFTPDDSPRWLRIGGVAQVTEPRYARNEWTQVIITLDGEGEGQ